MERNFFRRVEVAFPIERSNHRKRILRDLEIYLADNTHAWMLRSDGRYTRSEPGDAPPVTAQDKLLAAYASGDIPG
jgi:polyphosphate kinase